MKNIIKSLLLLFWMVIGVAYAIPAMEVQREYSQPDQTVFTGTLKGDEYFSWVDLGAGLIAIYNTQSKYFEYGVTNNEGLLKVSGISVQQEKHQDFLSKSQEDYSKEVSDSSTVEAQLEPVLSLVSPDGDSVDIKAISKASFKKTINKARLDAAPKPQAIIID